MKTIGIIGGMSWESTAVYYQLINREVGRRLGGLHSASILLLSVDFDDIATRQRLDDWQGLGHTLADAAHRLEQAGAQCLLIATNTMHRVADAVRCAVGVPLLHIADITADAIARQSFSRVALLGTRFTMEQAFFRDRLAARGIDCLVPDAAGRDEVHRIIFDELCQGRFEDRSRSVLQGIAADLARRGAQGVVLGCTELMLILRPGDLALPCFDTTTLHALAAVDLALGDVPRPAPAVLA